MYYACVLCSFMILTIVGCGTNKKAAPCGQCPHYTQEINLLKSKIVEDSLVIKTMERDYISLFDENQIFSSMLSEIENEPGGHEILEKLWRTRYE